MYKHAMHMVYIAALANCNVIISHAINIFATPLYSLQVPLF
jgi:hypothetical protein